MITRGERERGVCILLEGGVIYLCIVKTAIYSIIDL